MKHFKFKKGILACLLSLALAFSCFSTVGIKAEEAAATPTAPSEVAATYNWAENIIEAGSNAYVYVLKAEKGNTIKAGTAANGQMASNKISLADLKVTKINKDAYFYVCDKEFETEGKSINANLVIKATSVKKAAGTIDYTQADDDDSLTVLSATATDTAGKKIADPKVFWSTEANGTYCAVGDRDTSTTRKYADGNTAAKKGFDGRTLKEMLEAGGVVYIKIAGEDGGTGTAQFASKAIKVKVAKQAKAPKVKVDVKKDTFSIKNGMDFALFTKNGEKYELTNGGWKTVLPQLKDAATKKLEDSIVLTEEYKPVDKKDDSAKKVKDETTHKVSYTSLKIKNLSYETLIAELSADSAETTEYYIGVRTSATSKKPASAVTYFKYATKTEAPIVYTESCVSGQYLIASGTDFDKKGILLKDIANYNGVNGTSGYDDGFKLETTAGSGADTNAASYEFAIVNKADLDAEIIDWSTVGWKKLDVAKTKVTSKLKTGYTTVSNTTVKKVKAQLTAVAKPEDFDGTDIPDTVKSLILVRRAGVKGKTAEDSVVASNYIQLYVLKDGKNYEIYSETSVGEVAYKYTIKFAKYTGTTTGTGNSATTTYSWKVADDVDEITAWVKPGDTKKVAIAAVAGADFFKATSTGSGSGLTITPDTTSGSGMITIPTTGTDAGKYAVTIGSNESDDKTEYIAIREYANVKVVGTGVTGANGDAVANSDKQIALIKGGKVAANNNGVFTVANNAVVTAYVGDAVEIDVIDYTNPTGYVSGSGEVTVAAGDGYTVPTTGSWDGSAKKVKVTVNTADEVTVKVKNPIKKIKVTYSIAAPEGFTLNPTNASIAAVEVGSNGKIATAANVSAIKATKTETDGTTTTKVIAGWSKTSNGTTNVETTEVFTADATLYAIWK